MRNSRRSLVVLFVSLTAALTVPDRARGGSITYDVGTNSITQSGYLPQFDPSLGQLTSITYSGSAGYAGDFLLAQPQSSVTYAINPEFVLISSTDGTVFLSGQGVHGSLSFNPPTDFLSIQQNVNVSGDLGVSSFFYGTGELNLQIMYQGLVVPGMPLDDAAGANIAFTYTYGVPEPPGLILALISSALPICLLVRTRFAIRTY
jgi:hypothetical protein